MYQSVPLELLTIRHVNAAIDACARAQPVRLDTAVALVENSPLPPNEYTLGSLLSACARAGDVKMAVKWLHKLDNVRPNAVCYQAAMTACARSKDLACALRLLRRAENEQVGLTVIGYNIVLSAAAKEGDIDTARAVFRNMTESATHPSPDRVTYSTLLAACEAAGEWNQLLDYVDEMRSHGFRLDGMAWTSVLHACQQLGLADRALEALGDMKLELEATKSKSWKSRRSTAGWQTAGQRAPLTAPDEVAFTLVISACARGGAWQEAIRVLEESEQAKVATVMTYTAAISACEHVGRWREAFGLLDRMRKRGLEPNEVSFAAVLGTCAVACARADENEDLSGPAEKAMRLVRVLRNDPSVAKPNAQVFNAAIRVCAEVHDTAGALTVYDQMIEDAIAPNVVTYGSLMTACERAGDANGVSKIFRLLNSDKGVEPNEIVYGAAISACRKAGQYERCLLLLRKMVKEGCTPNVATFNTVLTAQAESVTKMQNKKERSQSASDRAVDVVQLMRESKNAPPNRQSYSILIRMVLAQQEPSLAEVELRNMRLDGFTPDVDLYTATVTAYEKQGQPLKALSLMESMRADGYDFYEAHVLNAAFKRVVKLVSSVGRGLGTSSDDEAAKPSARFT